MKIHGELLIKKFIGKTFTIGAWEDVTLRISRRDIEDAFIAYRVGVDRLSDYSRLGAYPDVIGESEGESTCAPWNPELNQGIHYEEGWSFDRFLDGPQSPTEAINRASLMKYL